MSTTALAERTPLALDPEFGEWVRRVRTNKGMTQEEMAAAMRMHRAVVYQLERGTLTERQLSMRLFAGLAEVLGMELGYLLHKAGFDIGAGGVKISRLKRVEDAAEAFSRAEVSMRGAVAEAIGALGKRDKLTDADVEALTAGLGRALGALDLVTERLREQGFQSDSFRRVQHAPSKPRPWTEADTDFLLQNKSLSHAEAAAQLGRTADAIRSRRGHLTREGRLSNTEEVSG